MTTQPSHDTLRTVISALEQAGLAPTLGGSGLLLAHGLVDSVRDWDVLVDADPAEVVAALDAEGLEWRDADTRTGQYATDARYLVTHDGAEVDVMVNFGVWPEGGAEAVRIPSLASGTWSDIPLGSLEAWLVAYRLMGREGKPERIREHFAGTAANDLHLHRMLAEPLPEHLRAELESLLNERQID